MSNLPCEAEQHTWLSPLAGQTHLYQKTADTLTPCSEDPNRMGDLQFRFSDLVVHTELSINHLDRAAGCIPCFAPSVARGFYM
jgi:hypothetical protein